VRIPTTTFATLTLVASALTLALPTAATATALTAGAHRVETQNAVETSGIGIRLVDIPAASQDDPRARSYIVDNVPPGTTIQRRIEVQNNTASAQAVSVYAGGATIQDGSFVGSDGDSPNELTTWTSIGSPTVDLAAGTSTKVLVTIAVPADAPEGEQYGAIWAEVGSAPTPHTNVVTASRAGIRMYLSVGPGNGPPSDFTIDELRASRTKAGEPAVTATVTNTGGRALDVSGTLSLTDGPSGLSAGPFTNGTATTIAPGKSSHLVVTLGAELPPGPWQAKLELKSGLVVHDVSAEITFPDAGSIDVAISDSPNAMIVALVIVAGIAVLAAAVSATILLRRRKSYAEALLEAGSRP
jgi:hypothetical protein